MKRFHLVLLTLVLFAAGLGLFAYKVYWLHFPTRPDQQEGRWVVEAHLAFSAKNQPVKAVLRIPSGNENFLLTDENFISRGFGLTTKIEDGNREAVWTKRSAVGPQGLYYRAVVRKGGVEEWGGKSEKPKTEEELAGVRREALTSLVTEARQRSADTETFVAAVIDLLTTRAPSSNIRLLLGRNPDALKKAQVAAQTLVEAGYKARVVHGVYLTNPGRNVPWVHRLQVLENNVWTTYDIKNGSRVSGDDFLPWWHGDAPMAEIKGGNRMRATVSVDHYQEEAMGGASEYAMRVAPGLVEFSLFSLPVETQRVYRIILLVPLGAFIVVLLRNCIGVTTFGTFMPVLVALAFRETELLWGLVFFTLLISLGLLARFYLENLKLLLVPRLSSVLTIVVLLMAVMSVMAHKLDMERGMSLALFPLVIMTMTIEHMSLVWDERGAFEALKQGAGTLMAAALVYSVIRQPLLQHLAFVFPELLLVVLALTILLGRYRGYRLLELRRFRALIKDKP